MLELVIVIGRALALAFRGHRELVFENLALRQQLTAVKRTTSSDDVSVSLPAKIDGARCVQIAGRIS
jgi:hypothetical protein